MSKESETQMNTLIKKPRMGKQPKKVKKYNGNGQTREKKKAHFGDKDMCKHLITSCTPDLNRRNLCKTLLLATPCNTEVVLIYLFS